MSRATAFVNYHLHSDQRQAYHIDAGGETGAILSPQLVSMEVVLSDLRDTDVSATFDADSVAFVNHTSSIRRFGSNGDWRNTYDRELTDLLTGEIGAKQVVVFDHTVRVDDPESDRRPARNVHSDYSPEGAKKRIEDLLGAEEARRWRAGRFGFVNIWRPIGPPINSAPLGFVRPGSVAPGDWITLDLIYPDRIGQIMGLTANENHNWLYQSRMRPDEVAIFNIYDSGGLPSIAHSALDRTEDPAIRTPRASIESRTLVKY